MCEKKYLTFFWRSSVIAFFIRFEQLHEDIRKVCNQLSIPFESHLFPEFMRGKRSNIPVSEYYDAETREIVEKNYAWELKEFSYSL